MAKQVSRALEIPLPRFPRRLETMNYLVEYEKEDGHDSMLLELARLNFDLARSLHLKELKTLSMWWRELYDNVKLTYSRDRLVESYLWTCIVFHEEEYSRARIIFAKVFGLQALMDDTYDVHASLEECRKLNEAIQRLDQWLVISYYGNNHYVDEPAHMHSHTYKLICKWDSSAVSIVPKYLHMFYIKLLSNFDELEDSLEPHEKYRISYIRNAFKLTSQYYLHEAQWCNDKYVPGFEEHMEVSIMSCGCALLPPMLLMGVHDGEGVATREVFEWVATCPDVMKAGAEVARFLNDIASYTAGKKKKDACSAVECYMAEHGVDGDAAVAAVAALAERAWRTMNQLCVEMDPALLMVKFTRTLEVIYLGGRESYTFGGDLNGLIAGLFLDAGPLNINV
uniref:Terpene synthase metal-binding domain-containing protein n=1 Tax=Oryza brachyantha TaxID=4533 RepID=J3LNZ3_ORYBR